MLRVLKLRLLSLFLHPLNVLLLHCSFSVVLHSYYNIISLFVYIEKDSKESPKKPTRSVSKGKVPKLRRDSKKESEKDSNDHSEKDLKLDSDKDHIKDSESLKEMKESAMISTRRVSRSKALQEDTGKPPKGDSEKDLKQDAKKITEKTQPKSKET